MGHLYRERYPDGHQRNTLFDRYGRRVIRTDGIRTTLTTYDGNSRPFRTATDMNANAQIDLAGPDRVQETATRYTQIAGHSVEENITLVYDQQGSTSTKETARFQRTLDGDQTWSIAYGRTTYVQTVRSPETASRTVMTTAPDGIQTVEYYTNALLHVRETRDVSNAPIRSVSYDYDAFLRLTSTAETAANGMTRTTTQQVDPAGNVTQSIIVAGSQTQTTAYAYGPRGRRVLTHLPDEGQIHEIYSDTGALIEQYGTRTYSVGYTYDEQGRMATLTTFRDGREGPGDTTRWTYHPQRGWLTAKIYADASSIQYAYDPAGRLIRRTGGRGIQTHYAYDPAGTLTNVSYSDSTAPIRYQPDRLGQIVRVTDAIGIHDMTYHADGKLATSTLPHAPGRELTYTYDAAGRSEQLSIRIGDEALYARHINYDLAGRIQSVSDGSWRATYSYAPDGRTINGRTVQNGGVPTLVVTNTYDGLDRLLSVHNSTRSGAVRASTYTYNAANQRTRMDLADGTSWRYGYDALGQLTNGVKVFSDGDPMGAMNFRYAFDTIGNRRDVSLPIGIQTEPETYAANALNQYTSRTVPSYLIHSGHAEPEAAVHIGRTAEPLTPAHRQGYYYWGIVPVENQTNPVAGTTMSEARIAKDENTEAVRSGSTPFRVPPTQQPFAYDLDGNLVTDGLWTYTWNGENRLVQMESMTKLPTSQWKKLTFAYDYRGRRIRKTTYDGFNGSTYTVTNKFTFIYDDWLPIAEIGSGFTNYMLHGPDVSGTLQGAGGVGGLLNRSLRSASDTNTYAYTYDGNGNVTTIVGSDNGTIVGEFEYDPFGQTIRASGAKVDTNPYRYSSKFEDAETGLLYYGYRYYYPASGRWLNRDPISYAMDDLDDSLGEDEPLYTFVLNDPIASIDGLGLYTLRQASNLAAPCSGMAGKKLKTCHTKHWKSRSDKQKFDHWYTAEKAQGAWWSSLPRCPKTLCMIGSGSLSPGGKSLTISFKPLNPDSKTWHNPQKPSSPEANLHPGAIWSMRSKADANNHANQCTYDVDGNLLPSYPGAGTVDWYKSGTITHYDHDVDPIYLANKIDGGASDWGLFPPSFPQVLKTPGINMNKYYEVRPLHSE